QVSKVPIARQCPRQSWCQQALESAMIEASKGDRTEETVPAIAVTRLTKRYGSTTAADDLTFEIAPGTIAGFLGPNGAGKTTTFRMLVGLAAPTSGEALVLGRPYASLSDPIHHVGAMLEV